MKKKPAKITKADSQNSDVLMLGGLYLLTFIAFQMVNFISATIKYGDFVDIKELKAKVIAQLLAFMAAYFITLIYIKNRSAKR